MDFVTSVKDLFLQKEVGECKSPVPQTSLWDFEATDIDGNHVDRLGDLAGSKATLVVNVATH